MKKIILYLMLASLFVLPVYATDYEITTPSFTSSLTLWSGDTLYMTAGEIGNLGMYEDSTAIIEGTSPSSPPDCDGCGMICMGCFYIEQINMADMSSLNMSGGQVEKLTMKDTATVVLDQSSYRITHVGQIDIKGNSSLSMPGGYVSRIDIGGIEGGSIVVDANSINIGGSGGGIISIIPDSIIINPNPIVINYDGIGSGVIALYPDPIIINPPPVDPFASPSVILTGGRIDQICSHRAPEAVSIEPSITLECSYYYYDEPTHMLTGCWLDGTDFSIELIDSEWSLYPTINDIQFVGTKVEDVYINGGTHTFDDAMFENYRVHLGYSTYVDLVDGGRVGWLFAYNHSIIKMTGGEIGHQLIADDSYVDMSGGSVGGSLVAQNWATILMTGGTVGNMLEVLQNGKINLYGTNFEVTDLDGITTTLSPWGKLSDFGTLLSPWGQTPYYAGTIAGTLSYGTVLNNTFKIEVSENSYHLFGDILIRKFMAYRSALVTLSQEKTGLLLKNNSALTIVTGSDPIVAETIIVNSLAKDAVLVQGKASISADGLQVAGGIDLKGSLSYPEDMYISENTGQEPCPDFFDLEEPDYTELPDICPVNPNTGKASPVVITGGQWTLEPGYYSAGIIIEDATVSFLPGIYHLGGANAPSGLVLKGEAVVDANEVMFHIVGTGQVSIGKDATLTATAPVSGDYDKFLFFQSRDNTSDAIFKGVADCGGILYFPANHAEVTGNVLCSMLMANTVELSSNGQLTVNPNYPPSE